MFEKIKQYYKIKEKNKLLLELVSEQKKLITNLQEQVGDPKKVVEKIFDREIKWFDYEELPEESRNIYYNEAQMILTSKAFSNEFNFLVSQKLEDLVLEARDFKDVRDFQMIVCGLELLRERLENIFIPNNNKK